MVIEPDYQVRLMNRAAADQLPAAMGSLDGPRCYQVSHRRDTPCEAPEHECPLEAVGHSGETVTVVHQHRQRGTGPLRR